jgi:hypothetical protein
MNVMQLRKILAGAPLLAQIALCGHALAASPGDELGAARGSYVACIKDFYSRMTKVNGLTPTGVAYFVGLACAPKREEYKNAMINAHLDNPEALLTAIDRVVATELVRMQERR